MHLFWIGTMALCPFPATPWDEEYQLQDQMHLSAGTRCNKRGHLKTPWPLYTRLVASWGLATYTCSHFSVALPLLPLACWIVGQRLFLLHWSQIISHTWEATEQAPSVAGSCVACTQVAKGNGCHTGHFWCRYTIFYKCPLIAAFSTTWHKKLGCQTHLVFWKYIWTLSSYHHESTVCSKLKRHPLVPMLHEGLLPEIAQLFCAPFPLRALFQLFWLYVHTGFRFLHLRK